MTGNNDNKPNTMPEFKEQLNNAFFIAKNRFTTFLGIGIIGIIAAAIMGSLWLTLSAKLITTPSITLITILPMIGIFLMVIPIILMFTAFFVAVVDQDTSSMKAYIKAIPKFPGMFAIIIISELAMTGGLFLLIIPGIILAVWLYFAYYIYVKEPIGVINSLVQSRECARGNFKLIFIRLLLIFLICLLCLLPLAIVLLVPIAGMIVFALGAYLVGALFFSYGYVLYGDISSMSGITQAVSLNKGQKAKSLLLALISIVVGLGAGAVSLQNKISDLKKSPMKDMMKIAISGDMSDPESQKAMQEMMNQQLQNMTISENNDMTPEAKQMIKQMLAQASTSANAPEEKPQIEKKEVKPDKIEKEVKKPVEKLTEEQKNEQTENEKKIRDVFTEVLSDRDWRIRRDAANALGIMGWPEYIPELKRLTRDKNREVKNAASMAIISIYSKNPSH